MFVELQHNDRDIGKVFARDSWSNGLTFIWDHYKRLYRYNNHEESPVGTTVLESSNIVDLNKKGEVKMKHSKSSKNYTGKYDMVVDATYDLDGGPVLSEYTFKTSIPLAEGDIVVVDAASGLGLVQITRVYEKGLESATVSAFNRATAWVVDKVNMDIHKERMAATERRKFILTQLEEKKAAMEETAIYTMLAQSDPDAAKLLEELKDL